MPMTCTHVANGGHHDMDVLIGGETWRVKCGHVEPFYRPGPHNFTIISVDGRNGHRQTVCRDLFVQKDQSIVVGKDGQVHYVRYGSIWVDNNGKNHFRYPN